MSLLGAFLLQMYLTSRSSSDAAPRSLMSPQPAAVHVVPDSSQDGFILHAAPKQ